MPDNVERLEGRTAGGGKKMESITDKWKCLYCVRVRNISVIG